MPDLTLICGDCHNEFIWTTDDQSFYATKGLEKPIFCLICRSKRKAMDRDPGRHAKKYS